ncbi:MAG: glutamate racemase [Calditrichaeota bacterium]|nr:MAG: glutamate racemase [Calditrichota bacterium]
MPDRAAPVGVFDSGIGGLTVVRQLMRLLPGEDIIYFGDTARIPYGTKSDDTVKRFALEDSFFLLDQGVKAVVVACNTASAIAIQVLRRFLPVPVVGVIEPGVQGALRETRNGRVGVIGTATTIRSGAYRRLLLAARPDLQVVSQPCPLFVPLVEEGWIEDEATYLIARRYLQPLLENRVDTVILGCTHYPLLRPVLGKVLGPGVRLVDSGVEAAHHLKQVLAEAGLLNTRRRGEHRFYLSDFPYKFQEIGERFLERTLPHVETVNFEAFLLNKGRRFWAQLEKRWHSAPVPGGDG